MKTRIRSRVMKSPAEHGKRTMVKNAVETYKAENKEIEVALEIMRVSRVFQDVRCSGLGRSKPGILTSLA